MVLVIDGGRGCAEMLTCNTGLTVLLDTVADTHDSDTSCMKVLVHATQHPVQCIPPLVHITDSLAQCFGLSDLLRQVLTAASFDSVMSVVHV